MEVGRVAHEDHVAPGKVRFDAGHSVHPAPNFFTEIESTPAGNVGPFFERSVHVPGNDRHADMFEHTAHIKFNGSVLRVKEDAGRYHYGEF